MKKLVLVLFLCSAFFAVNAQVGAPCTGQDRNGNYYRGVQEANTSTTTSTTTYSNSNNRSNSSSVSGSANASLTNPSIGGSMGTSSSNSNGSSSTTTNTTTTNTICVPSSESRRMSSEGIINGLNRKDN
ncbi:MAG: hypothetical protein II935_04315 [Bacteroidales bacterium]|nr:hypothetical protein [Bacteroidales bacterium]MBQ4475401.1 hypothetical protein [Bacteroidales bacterium]